MVRADVERNTPLAEGPAQKLADLSGWAPQLGRELARVPQQERQAIDTALDNAIAGSFNLEAKSIDAELSSCMLGGVDSKGEKALAQQAAGSALNDNEVGALQDYAIGLKDQSKVLRDAASNYQVTVPKLAGYFSARAEQVDAKLTQVKAALDKP